MSEQLTQTRTNWFKRFMIFLLAVVVAISLGLVVYYFLQDDETLGLNQSSIMVNKGDKFSVEIIHENGRDGTTFELDWDKESGILRCDNLETAKNKYEFTALAGGTTKLELITNNPKFQNMTCDVSVGVGTQANPFYIKTAEDLASIGIGNESEENFRPLDAYYVQLNSIDLASYNNGVWTPLAGETGFSGSYDGSGFVIYNLNVNETQNKNAGLFTKINQSGIISRIIFEKATISGNAQNAGVVAGINSGTISRVEVKKGSLLITNSSGTTNVGGIVGKMERASANTKLDRVAFYEQGAVSLSSTSQGFVGGLVGTNNSGTIINSFSRGSVTASGDSIIAGGIAGKVMTDSSITDVTTSKKGNVINSYSTMVLNGNTKGAIVGLNVNQDGTNTFTNNSETQENRYVGVYYVFETGTERNVVWTSTETQSNVVIDEYAFVSGVSFNDAKLKETYKTYNSNSTSGANYSMWDFDNVWEIISEENDGLPVLRMMGASVPDSIFDPQSPLDETIKSQAQLALIANDLNAIYEIGKDFEITSTWTQIGTKENPFNGILDGKGYTITVNNGVTFQGLFGYLGVNAQIINLNIVGVNITSGDNVGIIASYNDGLIQNCMVSGHITITGEADKNIGGIAGVNSRTGQIIKCSIGTDEASPKSVTIQATTVGTNTYNVGAVTGFNEGLILDAVVFNKSSVSVVNENGIVYAGGITGQNASNGSIKNSINMASVEVPISKENNFAGGIAGFNGYRAKIEHSKVDGTMDDFTVITGYMVGGLVGENSAEDINSFVSITKCEVTEKVNLTGNKVGGLVGRMYRGVMGNCATFANLSAETMAGFAVTVEGYSGSSANGKYAIIDTCFSSATFNGSAGNVYSETTSHIRATNNFLYCMLRGEDTSNPNSYKIAGFINNSKYNKTNLDATGQDEKSYRQFSSAYIGGWNWQTPNDGATSDDDCKKTSTFKAEQWNSSIWDIAEGEYPRIEF